MQDFFIPSGGFLRGQERKGKNKMKKYEIGSMLMWIMAILMFLSTFWWY